MAGTSIGSIYARIGADTSEFQAKLASSNADLSRWAGGIGGVTTGIESHFVTMGRGVTTVFNSIGLGGSQVEFALGRILQNIGMVELAFPAALIAMAPAIGKWVSNVTGLTAAVATAEGPVKELANVFYENADAYSTAHDTLGHLMDQLHIAQPEFMSHTKVTRDDAAMLVTWMNSLSQVSKEMHGHIEAIAKNTAEMVVGNEVAAATVKLANDRFDAMVKSREEQIRFNNVWGQMVPVAAQVQIAMAAGNKAMQDLGDSTLKAYNILSQTSAAASLEDMEKKLRAVSLAGGDVGQVLAKMGPALLTAITDAKEMGVKIPFVMEDVALAIEEKNKLWLGDLMAGLKKTPDAAREAAAGSAKYLDDMGKNLEGAISGGFGRGMDKGTNYADQQLADWVRKVGSEPIKLTFDLSDLDRAIADALSGRRRGVPGMAPS